MKYRNITFWGITGCCLFCFLQYKYSFYFYYIEQLQVFPVTWKYFWDAWSEPVGIASYLSGFLLQFFSVPYAGALITSCLLLAVGVLVQRIFGLMMPALLLILTFLPLHLDMNYRLQGTVSFLFLLIAFLLYIHINKPWRRFASGLLLLPVLFWLGGSVMSLFVVSVISRELLYRKRLWYCSLLLLVGLAVIFYLSVYSAWQGEYRMILFPDLYYEPLLKTEKIYYAWIVFFTSILFIRWLRVEKDVSGTTKGLFILSAECLIFLFVLYRIGYNDDSILQENMKQDYYLRTEQWNKIIETFSADKANIQTMSILNLALASRGELGDKLFHYPQSGKECLLPEWDSTLPNAIALSDLNFHLGNIAAAQELAFEGNVSSLKGNPRLLQRLVQTNLIYGAYPVAEKYIRLLEQTLFYRKWANRQRKYLYNDKCVQDDILLGPKRKSLIGNGNYAVNPVAWRTLEQLAINNPDNPMAFQYLLAWHMLGKTLKAFNALYDKYYRTPVWPSLSVSHQEAIVALFQDSPSVWAQKGVGLKVEQRFGAFNQDMIDKHGYVNFETVMETSYGDTYWFYLMFKK